VRAGKLAPALAPGAVIGGLLLLLALVRGGGMTLGWALALAGAVYIGSLEAAGAGVDGAAPLVATGLLLCGELARWSLDTRLRLRSDETLAGRRGLALAALACSGLAASALTVAVSAAPAERGLAWTALGAAAAVGAAGAGVWLARR